YLLVNLSCLSGFDGSPSATLQFDVELLSMSSVKDIWEKWENPKDLGEVLGCRLTCLCCTNTFKYEARLEDGRVVSQSEGVEFVVRGWYFCPALEKAVRKMKKKEKVLLTVKPQYGFGEKSRAVSGQEVAVPPNATLLITLELLSWKIVTEVTSDKKVIKKIDKEGEGYEKPNDGTVAKGNLKSVWNFVTIEPEYAFGSSESQQELAVVPAGSTVYHEVELVSFVKDKESWDMDNNEKIVAAGRKKEEGNALFKDGKYARASKRYEKVLPTY
ncbi:hypothetical protein MKX01_012942, partial [Papaver californicum]